jgi:hypothetical protein
MSFNFSRFYAGIKKQWCQIQFEKKKEKEKKNQYKNSKIQKNKINSIK